MTIPVPAAPFSGFPPPPGFWRRRREGGGGELNGAKFRGISFSSFLFLFSYKSFFSWGEWATGMT